MERPEQRPRPRAAAAIAIAGLVPCVAVFALAPHDRLLDPLTFVLAATAASANFADVHYEGSLWVSGAFVCYLMAAAVLGVAPAMAIAAFAEGVDAAARRFRAPAIAVNVFGAVAPTLLAALVLTTIDRRDSPMEFVAAVTAAALFALGVNATVLSVLSAIGDGGSARVNLRATRRLAPVLLLDVALAVLVTLAYREFGFAVSVFLILTVVTVVYMLRLLVSTSERSREIEGLARTRGRLVAQALDAEEHERKALAERLHDHAVQSLLAARQDVDDARHGSPESLSRAHTAIEDTIDELRDAVFNLHPSLLDHAGLAAALAAVSERYVSRGECRCTVEVDARATGINDQLLFSLGRELLINAGKHANASDVALQIAVVSSGQGRSIVLDVRDDGIGFSEAKRLLAIQEGHIGLATSAERVKALDGKFDIVNIDGGGAHVRVELPITSDETSPRLAGMTI